MLRLFLSLYFVLAVAIATFVVGVVYLPDMLFRGLVYQHYGRVAEGPLFLLKEDFAERTVESWPQHIEELSGHFGYVFERVYADSLELSEDAATQLKDGEPVIIDRDGTLNYLLLPLEGDAFIIGFGIEQPMQEKAERLMGGFFHLLAKRLDVTPRDQWPSTIESLGLQFYFPLELMDIDAVSLDDDDMVKLRQGRIVGLNIDEDAVTYDRDDERYLKRIEGTSKVLQIGPIPNPWIAQTINYIVLVVLAAVIALAALVWLRSLWHDMTMLDQSTVALGQGKLDTRLDVSRRSPVKGLATTFNFMAERIQHLIGAHKELTNAVSHELRTPIARLRFAIDMLDDARDDTDRHRYLQNVRADIDELDSLVNELLGYARLDREKPELRLDDISLSPWLDEIVDQTSLEAPEIDVTRSADPAGQALRAMVEPRLMSRAVSNILRNAAHYADSAVRVSAKADEGVVQITIDDDGPGIPAGDRERIFEPFTRLDTSRTRASGGHGLGLAIVHRIMEWHQGEVRVDVSPLGGARFCLSWPRGAGDHDG
ncbi:MAG: ATP-binding protein [Geminicoccaceae bacterium]